MARIYPLFSSSKGNCIYFGDSREGILIDCGVSCKRICCAMEQNGLDPSAVRGVFVTHTHSDHISGLKTFLKKYPLPLYAQQINIDMLIEKDKLPEGAQCHAIDGQTAVIGGFEVSCFPTPHDTPASCGYKVVYSDGKTAVLCTDLGEVTTEVYDSISGADLVLLESNYDSDMLRNGSYPYELKERIAGSRGHLSNSDCGENLRRLAADGTMHFVLGHLSEENNTPQLAERSAMEALSPLAARKDYTLYLAPPSGGGAVVF